MTGLLEDPRTLWAVGLVLVLPALVIASSELQERLRQRDSALQPVVALLRRWTLPLLAVWAVARGLAGLAASNLFVRLVATALLVSAATAAISVSRLVVARLRRRRLQEQGKDGRGRTPQLLLALPRLGVLLLVGWLLVDTVWGVDLSAALTALGVTSLVISFALQDTLGGLASGLLLVADAPFEPGDWIRFGELEGRVVDVNWRSSRIENRDGDLLVVPNAELAGATLVNLDRPTRTHRVVVPVQVAYANPPTLATAMLLDAARSTPDVLEEPAPGVRVVQVDDPLMGYEVDLWIDDAALAPRVASDFGALVWYASHRHDVPLPSPAFDLYVYDGVATTEAARPARGELRDRLCVSPLLADLAEGDLDRLVDGSTAVRFARGETILAGSRTAASLHVLWEGRARIVVDNPGAPPTEVSDLVAGDLFGLLGATGRAATAVRVVAVSDCEVVVVDAATAGEVIGRNQALSTAIEQVMASRRRRVERFLASGNGHGSLHDVDVT